MKTYAYDNEPLFEKSEDKIKTEIITEQELKDDCTPDMIKWMCEFTEGFSIENDYIKCPDNVKVFIGLITKTILPFSTLIRRGCEGWNKKCKELQNTIYIKPFTLEFYNRKKLKSVDYEFKNYQPQSLTQAECACLHCLQERFREENK